MNYNELKLKFKDKFGDKGDIRIYSAPGRVELSGNHTDHQGGVCLAAAINLETAIAAARNGEDTICAFCEGFGEYEISITELSAREAERNSTPALIRGIATALSLKGAKLSGVDMYISSEVLIGSGLSSSAAFEVAVATALSDFWGASLSPIEIAEISGFAERKFFGKPCGLMDQVASSFGGVVEIDFESEPARVRKIDFDLEKTGYDLVIIDVGADHSDLTGEYAAIPAEMGQVASFFGKVRLCEVDEAAFYKNIRKLRCLYSDRAVLRAHHYFSETKRAKKQAEYLQKNDFKNFLELVRESGASSFKYLQNIYPSGEIKRQDMALGLALSERLIRDRGAVRIQGGGFGGTLEAFVERSFCDEFIKEIEKIFGSGSCKVLSFRAFGGRAEKEQ